MRSIFFLTISFFVVCSFTSNKESNDKLFSMWTYASYEGDVLEYRKVSEFENMPAIQFNEDGTMLKWQNSGWCGTPPISYGKYDGTWSYTSDSKIKLRYDYWGGEIEEEWEIVSLKSKRLIVRQTGLEKILTRVP